MINKKQLEKNNSLPIVHKTGSLCARAKNWYSMVSNHKIGAYCNYRVGQHKFLFYNTCYFGCISSSSEGVVSFDGAGLEVSKKIQSVAIIRWISEERAFAVEAYFSHQQSDASLSNSFQCSPERPCSGPEINRSLHG